MISEDTRERLLSENFEEHLEIQESKERYYNSILEYIYIEISPPEYLVCKVKRNFIILQANPS